MGEISFSYSIKSEPLYETSFKYWFSESIEHTFAYQRYIAFSDASIFNSPVAITKVATGLYQYYDLFLDNKVHAAIYGITLGGIHNNNVELIENVSEKLNEANSHSHQMSFVNDCISQRSKFAINEFNKENFEV